MIQNFKRNKYTHFTIKRMNLSNNTFSITRPIDNFFKNIVRLTQIFEGARAIFGGGMASPP